MKQKNLFESFISTYNELDSYMRKALNMDKHINHSYLVKKMSEIHPLFATYAYELQIFADLRNIIDHNPYRVKAHPMATPHADIVRQYEDIKNAVLHPKKAFKIAVTAPKIYTTTMESNALEVMETMNKKAYSHVPVIEKDKMVGVFSESIILSYLVKQKDSLITREVKVKEFAEFIPINNHLSEYFEFVDRDSLLVEVQNLFGQGLKEGKRIAVVFITEHGKREEKLLGIITPWDVAGKKHS